jgi:hypothetical protein
LAYRAIGHVFTSFTIVVIKKKCINTHSTIVTVPEVLSTTNTTKATIGTVVRRFIIRHPQITYVAMVGTKLGPTSNTEISTGDEKGNI